MKADFGVSGLRRRERWTATSGGAVDEIRAQLQAGRENDLVGVAVADQGTGHARPGFTRGGDMSVLNPAVRLLIKALGKIAVGCPSALQWRFWMPCSRSPNEHEIPRLFSMLVMAGHAIIIGVDLRRSGEALRAANGIDAESIASMSRRSRAIAVWGFRH